jgi:hypothetical protein
MVPFPCFNCWRSLCCYRMANAALVKWKIGQVLTSQIRTIILNEFTFIKAKTPHLTYPKVCERNYSSSKHFEVFSLLYLCLRKNKARENQPQWRAMKRNLVIPLGVAYDGKFTSTVRMDTPHKYTHHGDIMKLLFSLRKERRLKRANFLPHLSLDWIFVIVLEPQILLQDQTWIFYIFNNRVHMGIAHKARTDRGLWFWQVTAIEDSGSTGALRIRDSTVLNSRYCD